MNLPRVGLDLPEKVSARAALDAIRRAETRGVPMLWSTTTPQVPDTLTLFAAAAISTERIGLGTAVVPTYPRHPTVVATQVLALDQLAPGRLRLGVGPSHRPTIEGALGIPMDHPLDHLREYVTVLRALLNDGAVEFEGTYFRVRSKLVAPAPVPIYISALRVGAFRLAGEVADGAISWLCPLPYLQQTAIPAMHAAAAHAGRAAPRMIAHVPVAMIADPEQARELGRRRIRGYARMPFYARMFADAGYPVEADGSMPDELLDHLVIAGDDVAVRERLAAALANGIDELLVMLIPGDDPAGEEERLSAILAGLAND